MEGGWIFNTQDYLDVQQAALLMSNEYRIYFKNRAQNLSHYFRYVYNMFKIIHESELCNVDKKKICKYITRPTF